MTPPPPFPNPPASAPSASSAVHPSLPLANEVLALQTLLLQRDERIHAMHAQFENARQHWAQTETHLHAELDILRQAVTRLENSRIEIVLDQALRQGRIAPAERPLWNERLRQDFEPIHEDLINRPEVMHTRSITGELGKNRIDLSNSQQRQHLLQELMAAKQKLGLSHLEAWIQLKAERPDIFNAMNGNV